MSLTPFLSSLAAATAPRASEQQLLDVDGTSFVMFGLFVLTAFALTKLLWKPYLKVREERVTRVEGYRKEASRLENEASTRLTRVEAQLAEARRTGSTERARARAEAQAKEQDIVAEAQRLAGKALGDARARLDTAFAAERAKLQERAMVLGREITEKVLGRRVSS
jgi:F-type H+-transporting ATPase subunit b